MQEHSFANYFESLNISVWNFNCFRSSKAQSIKVGDSQIFPNICEKMWNGETYDFNYIKICEESEIKQYLVVSRGYLVQNKYFSQPCSNHWFVYNANHSV